MLQALCSCGVVDLIGGFGFRDGGWFDWRWIGGVVSG